MLAAMLAACQQSSAPAEKEQGAVATAPDAKPGMSVERAELVLPVVSGRPGGVYFQVRNGGAKPVSLVSAWLEGASSAEIHETSGGKMEKRDSVPIQPGETVDFARGGLHVMAFDLSDDLGPGGTTELTLTFADGDKISVPVAIAAGGTGGDMSGMNH